MNEKLGDVSVAMAKAAPPIGAVATGLTLNEWVGIGTLLYLALQAAYLLWKWRKEAYSRV